MGVLCAKPALLKLKIELMTIFRGRARGDEDGIVELHILSMVTFLWQHRSFCAAEDFQRDWSSSVHSAGAIVSDVVSVSDDSRWQWVNDHRQKHDFHGGRTGAWKDVVTDGRTDVWTDWPTDVRTDVRTNWRTDGRTDEQTDGRLTDWRTDGRMVRMTFTPHETLLDRLLAVVFRSNGVRLTCRRLVGSWGSK